MTTVVALKEQERAGKAGARRAAPPPVGERSWWAPRWRCLPSAPTPMRRRLAQTRSGGGEAGAPLLPTPLATSVQAGGGTWATVAMGDLGQPLDTFWQLLFRPSRASSWSDRVEATAVATNGGLVLASGSNSLVVGVRPSNNLTFSPLISTSDGGRSWSNGLLNQGLVSRPQALASARTGARWRSSRVAREPKCSGTPKIFRPGSPSRRSGHWRPPPRAAPAGRVPSRLSGTSRARPSSGRIATAVGRPGSSCNEGAPGIWPARPSAPGKSGPRSWAYCRPTCGLTALLELASATGSSGSTTSGFERTLVAAWANAKGAWRTSAPLVLGRGDRLVSFGATPTSGVFALIAAPDGRKELVAAPGLAPRAKGEAGAGWRRLPAPPQTTATVAYLPGGTVDALAVSKTVLTVWALAPSSASLSAKWVKGQVLNVPVQFGSSS